MNRIFLFFISAFIISSCTYDKAEISPCENADAKYGQDIAPLVATRCALSGCHNGDSISVGNFNNYAEIKLRVDNGQFKSTVIDSRSMPPVNKPALSGDEFNKLKCWFDAGAPNN